MDASGRRLKAIVDQLYVMCESAHACLHVKDSNLFLLQMEGHALRIDTLPLLAQKSWKGHLTCLRFSRRFGPPTDLGSRMKMMDLSNIHDMGVP